MGYILPSVRRRRRQDTAGRIAVGYLALALGLPVLKVLGLTPLPWLVVLAPWWAPVLAAVVALVGLLGLVGLRWLVVESSPTPKGHS